MQIEVVASDDEQQTIEPQVGDTPVEEDVRIQRDEDDDEDDEDEEDEEEFFDAHDDVEALRAQQQATPPDATSPGHGTDDAPYFDSVEEDDDDNADGEMEEEELGQPRVEVEPDLARALAAKANGNAAFGLREFEDAVRCFDEAILYAPPDDAENLSIFYSNRAAAKMKLELYVEAVEDCTDAIELNDSYVKAIRRRALALEKLEKYAECLEDIKRLLELKPGDKSTIVWGRTVEEKLKVQTEKQKEEMLGKLKELGNGLLGKFGLSLDNFKTVQDPETGGYSVSFQN